MSSKQFRIAEIFGPTIQGEGRNVGMPCHFVRFGGCDFRCHWCDTPHAVLPEQVKLLPKMDEWEIVHKVTDLELGANQVNIEWVVLTGGNPALFSLEKLIADFHTMKYKIMVETQGSIFKEWFGQVDDLCFSPKPPSAGNTTNFSVLNEIIHRTMKAQIRMGAPFGTLPYLKVPIFTDEDLDYAEEVVAQFSNLEIFLSIGNDDPTLPTVGNPNPKFSQPMGRLSTAKLVLENFKEVLDKVLTDRPSLQACRIFPQQHVLLWGNERGH